MPEKNAPDKLDRYRSHFLEDAKLLPKEYLMLRKYKKANSLLCSGYTRNQAVKILVRDFSISDAQAYLVIRDSIKLYGDVTESDKKGMKHILYENFMKASQQAHKAGDYRAYVKALEMAAKVHGLFTEETHPFDLEEFMRLKPLIFTTDHEVLKLQQLAERPIEDISHEDIDEE